MISWEYLAGVVDADGCISLHRNGKRANQVVPRVTIANTSHDFLARLQSQFGGELRLRDQGFQPGWKPFGSLQWRGRAAQDVLEHIHSHVLLKKPRVEVALEIFRLLDLGKKKRCDYVKDPRPGLEGRVVAKLKPEIVRRETELVEEMHRLNKRGA